VALPHSESPNRLIFNSLAFLPDGTVEYSIGDDKNLKKVKDRYKVYHKGDKEVPAKPPVLAFSNTITEEVITLVEIVVNYDNRFDSESAKMLKFKDLNGNQFFFQRDDSLLPPGVSVPKPIPHSLDKVAKDFASVANILKPKGRTINSENTKEISQKLDSEEMPVHGKSKYLIQLMNEGDESCVPVLIKHIDAKQPLLIRQNAMRALGKVGDRRAVPALLEILNAPIEGDVKDGDTDECLIRRYAVGALLEIGDISSLAELKRIEKSTIEYSSVSEIAEIAVREIEAKNKQK